jgi:hypothetical protein
MRASRLLGIVISKPSPGYRRLLKESVLQIWKARKAAVSEEIASAERAAKAIQDKLDRLDEAFLFERSIDIETYDRHAEKLREELTLARIDRHSGQLDELDVDGILAFAERALPRAADRLGAGVTRSAAAAATTVLSRRNCVRRKRLCWNRCNHRPSATCGKSELCLVDQTGASWNQIAGWLRQLDAFRMAA